MGIHVECGSGDEEVGDVKQGIEQERETQRKTIFNTSESQPSLGLRCKGFPTSPSPYRIATHVVAARRLNATRPITPSCRSIIGIWPTPNRHVSQREVGRVPTEDRSCGRIELRQD